jgi:hypothetical protein
VNGVRLQFLHAADFQPALRVVHLLALQPKHRT